jgi:predicted phage terminase large subunit-like protein
MASPSFRIDASKVTPEALDALIEHHLESCRQSFWYFRQTINPKMKKGWWQEEVAGILQAFFEELASGKRPKYVIEAPPQHGKSEQVIDFIAWALGRRPDLKTIYTSFSDRLGIRANLRLQRVMDSPAYQAIFPATRLSGGGKGSGVKAIVANLFSRNRDLLEIVNHSGFFRNTTVEGSITGEGLDLGIVDDPLKGRRDANSTTKRNAVWDWFTDDFMTRFSDDAGMICILTRWHIDDPVGRLLEKYPSAKVFKYPALALKGDKRRKEGEPLFPEHKSLEFLLERKAGMAESSWLSLYQQSPIKVGGAVIKPDDFKRYVHLPKLREIMLFGDTAQKTKEANDFTVFQAWGLGDDELAYFLDQWRKKVEAPELRQAALDFWEKWKAKGAKKFFIEDKASGTGLIQELKRKEGVRVFAIQRSVDKYTRVTDILHHIEAGHVAIPESAPWVADFVAECESFTADNGHEHDDQIDPMVDAIKHFLQPDKKKGFFS